MLRFALPIAFALGGCAMTAEQAARDDAEAARAEAKLQADLAGYTAGRPQTCISPTNQQTQIYGDAIVYYGASSRKYLTRTTGGCLGTQAPRHHRDRKASAASSARATSSRRSTRSAACRPAPARSAISCPTRASAADPRYST